MVIKEYNVEISEREKSRGQYQRKTTTMTSPSYRQNEREEKYIQGIIIYFLVVFLALQLV
jgi:hypothetical protein